MAVIVQNPDDCFLMGSANYPLFLLFLYFLCFNTHATLLPLL